MIFITGAARSGTSLTTEILQGHGLDIGKVNGLNENLAVREKVLKRYLKACEADPMGQKPLPDTDNLPPYPSLHDDVITALENPSEPWGYKDAKLTLVWPVWAEAFPDAKWILVRRNGEDIARSCMRTGFMRAYTQIPGWMRWVAEHESRFEEMKKKLNLIEVWPSEFIKDHSKFAPVAEFCGFNYQPDVMGQIIDATRWH